MPWARTSRACAQVQAPLVGRYGNAPRFQHWILPSREPGKLTSTNECWSRVAQPALVVRARLAYARRQRRVSTSQGWTELDNLGSHGPEYAQGHSMITETIFLAYPSRERELVLLRVARRTSAAYEWGGHALAAQAAGPTAAEIRGVLDDTAAWSSSEAALLQAVDELCADNCVSDTTWAALSATRDDQQVIEVLVLTGLLPDERGYPEFSRRATGLGHAVVRRAASSTDLGTSRDDRASRRFAWLWRRRRHVAGALAPSDGGPAPHAGAECER